MRAVQVEQPKPTAASAEEDEILAEDAKTKGNLAEVTREGDRLPEAPKVLTARRAGPHAGQLFVRSRHVAQVVSPVGTGPGAQRTRPQPSR